MLHATTPGTLALTRGFYFSLAVLWWSPASAAPQPLPMQGEETENFLVSADRVKKEAIPIGITHPDLFTLIAKSSKHENAKQPHWAQARSSCWGTRSPPL